jgi:acyl-CoA thioester hydrolase
MDRLDPPPTVSPSTAASFVTQVRVRYAETDAAGVVYYANYLTYFEVARVEWLRALGCPVIEAEARGVLLLAVEARVRYLQPAHLDDLLAIHVWATDVKRVSFAFEYEVRRGDDLVARGYTRHAAVDRDDLRPLALPEWMRDLLERAQGARGPQVAHPHAETTIRD